ncbi:MAG TPA: hypothetical protein ENK14_03085 [Caldithrix sp.]|nr:hypothetical protein [Caldithrix sp.]
MLKSRYFAFIVIARPVNVLIGMLSIFIAAFITGTLQPFNRVLFAVVSGGIITAAANTINDYFDLAIDRVNKPYRPLPSGQMSVTLALNLSIAEFFAGIILSVFISRTAFLIASTISLLLFFYSFKLKRVPLWGNLAVSFASAMAFIYGGVAVDRVSRTLIPAAFAFFYHFGRELIKDIQDMEGDARDQAKTFPLVFGKTAALRLTTLNFLLLIIFIAIPFIFGWYGSAYFVVILIGVYPVLLFSIYRIWSNQSFASLGFVSNLLKADMLIGLLAIYLG